MTHGRFLSGDFVGRQKSGDFVVRLTSPLARSPIFLAHSTPSLSLNLSLPLYFVCFVFFSLFANKLVVAGFNEASRVD